MDEWSRMIDYDYKHCLHASHVEVMGDGNYYQVFYTMLSDLTKKLEDTNRNNHEVLLENAAQTATISMLHDTVEILGGDMVAANQKCSKMRTVPPLQVTTSNHPPSETQLTLEMGSFNGSASQSNNLGEYLAAEVSNDNCFS